MAGVSIVLCGEKEVGSVGAYDAFGPVGKNLQGFQPTRMVHHLRASAQHGGCMDHQGDGAAPARFSPPADLDALSPEPTCLEELPEHFVEPLLPFGWTWQAVVAAMTEAPL